MRVFKAALWCLKNKSSYPEMFVRDLAMAGNMGCDTVYDLSAVRNAIENDVGKEGMKRIIDYEEFVIDHRKAQQVRLRYFDWALSELRNASKESWWSWS